jgi:hypothetical protein
MAITIFSIPPMSVEPEQVFSGTKHTIAPERIRRGAEMVEITECLKSWVRISPGKEGAVLSGIFRNATQVEEAAAILENARIEADQDPREDYIIL